MKVKVSRPMVKALNETLEQHGMKAVLQEFTVDQYRQYVDYDVYRNETDYSEKKNKMRAIVLHYPDSCYAMPAFITTRDLSKVFKRCSGTWNTFIQEFMNCYEI